jgi:hypothetical protein
MSHIDSICVNAFIIVEGVAFEVIKNDGIIKIIATDLENPENKASFIKRGHDLIMSASSFREHAREQALLDAVRINNNLLTNGVDYA